MGVFDAFPSLHPYKRGLPDETIAALDLDPGPDVVRAGRASVFRVLCAATVHSGRVLLDDLRHDRLPGNVELYIRLLRFAGPGVLGQRRVLL
jgi:hypothetical protein